MNEEGKAKLKAKAKKYAPYAQAAISLVVTGVAAYYMRENNLARREIADLRCHNPHGWPTIGVHPDLIKRVQRGETLKYRERQISPDEIYVQATTRDEWSDDMNKKFNVTEMVPEGSTE